LTGLAAPGAGPLTGPLLGPVGGWLAVYARCAVGDSEWPRQSCRSARSSSPVRDRIPMDRRASSAASRPASRASPQATTQPRTASRRSLANYGYDVPLIPEIRTQLSEDPDTLPVCLSLLDRAAEKAEHPSRALHIDRPDASRLYRGIGGAWLQSRRDDKRWQREREREESRWQREVAEKVAERWTDERRAAHATLLSVSQSWIDAARINEITSALELQGSFFQLWNLRKMKCVQHLLKSSCCWHRREWWRLPDSYSTKSARAVIAIGFSPWHSSVPRPTTLTVLVANSGTSEGL
jgi:hypothetical protein